MIAFNDFVLFLRFKGKRNKSLETLLIRHFGNLKAA